MQLNQTDFSVAIEFTVPFHDVDAMGVVWHGNYFRYFEVAREALLAKFNYGYREMNASGYVWPIIDTRVKYRAAIEFEQVIKVHATLVEYENRLRIDYRIDDVATGKKMTTGYTIQVAVDMQTREMGFASPAVLLERLGLNK